MICPSCGGASSNSARFCGTCGNPLQRICGSCGAEIGATHDFCSACGVSIDGGPESEESPSADTEMVSVLVADVVEATGPIDGSDPGPGDEVVAQIVEAMREGVHRYGGVVHPVEGDGVIAVFSATAPDEQHAVEACFAAVDIPRLVRAVSPEAQVRVGVHSGEVAVHPESDDVSTNYAVDGPTVRLADRIERSGRPGVPLVSAAAASLAGGNVRLGPIQEIDVAGLDSPLEVYELMGKADPTGSVQSRLTRRLSPLVGRSRELAELGGRLLALDAGSGGVVLVVGEPGVGKSRLLIEFVRGLPESVELLTSAASPYDRSTPYRPIAEMMRSWLGRRGGGEHNVEEILEALDPSLTLYADALLALIGGEPSESWISTDAGLRRHTTRRAIRAILGASAEEKATVLIFDDLHWIDGESLAVMDELVDLAGATPLLILVTSRHGGDDRWSEFDHAVEIELDGLMGTEVSEFVEILVGTRSSTTAIRAELTERTDGTPLFLEEIVRSLADAGVLTGENGKYKRGETDLRIDMPTDVQSVIASRIERLPGASKELLQLLAVHGEDVRKDLLDATTDQGGQETDDAMSTLIAAEMMYANESVRPISYSFKHNLIREVAYAGVDVKRREALHARVAEGVIALEFEEDWTERLAHHTFEAGQWEEAARFALASAKRAAAKSAYRESEGFLSMSLEALAVLPKNRANMEQTIDALITRQISGVGLGGGSGDGFDSLDDAESLANELGDLERVARVNLHRSYARSMTGHHRQGLIDADRAHGIGQQLGRRTLTAEANLAKAQHYAMSGDPARIGGLIGHDLAFFRDEAGRNGMAGFRVVWAHIHLAIANTLLGHFDAGRQASRDAMSQAREHGLAVDVVYGFWAATMVEIGTEDFKTAAGLARESADMAVAHEMTWAANLIEIGRGYSLARLGSFDEGVIILERCADVGEALRAPMHQAWARVHLSELMTACGQNEEAQAHAQTALMLARKAGLKAIEVIALQMLGRSQHLLKESRAFLEEALGLSIQHSLRPLAAHIRLELGWIVSEMGDVEAGHELMTGANLLRAEMGLAPFEVTAP